MPRPVTRRIPLAWLGLACALWLARPALAQPAVASAPPAEPTAQDAGNEPATLPATETPAEPTEQDAGNEPATPPATAPPAASTVQNAGNEPATPPADETPADEAARDAAGERELGARLGVAMGRRFTPGGVRAAGVMLYRLSDDDWFEGSMAFTFGRSRTACFTDRDGDFACDYGVIDGTAIDLVAGIRRFLPGPERFAPYLRAGAGVRYLSFGGDDVRGFAIPLSAGTGVRARVNDLVAVGADVGGELGIAWLDHGLGTQSQLGIVLQATVELWLD